MRFADAGLQEGELLPCRGVSREYPDRRIEHLEPVGGAHGDVHEVAFGERERTVIDVHNGIALEHVEPLIRCLMDVRRRPTADGDIYVKERVAAGCLVRRGEETYPIGARPERSGADAPRTTKTSVSGPSR